MNILYKLLYVAKYTMRFSILSVFTTLFVVSIIILTLITFFQFRESISNVAFQFMEQASASLYEKIAHDIDHISTEAEVFKNLVHLGVIHPDNEKMMLDYTFGVLESKNLSNLNAVYFADESGRMFLSKKNLDGSMHSEVIDLKTRPEIHKIIYRNQEGLNTRTENLANPRYDPRSRTWYVLAKKEKQFVWTDVYPYREEGFLGITAATPIYKKNGELLGVFGLDLRLDNINHLIENMNVSKNGMIYIVSLKNDKVISYPHLLQFKKGSLININDVPLPWLKTSFEEYKKTHEKAFRFWYQGKKYFAIYRHVPELGKEGWVVGMVAPQSDFITELVRTNLLVLLLSFIILILGILLMSKLVDKIVNPLKKVVNETEKIKNFELDNSPPIESRIKEVSILATAIYAMKKGLQSFKKYVPANLVRQLIVSGQDVIIGGDKKELAIFFSDIENFTSISEQTDPSQLMKHLCEYFNEITHIIYEEQGTIDKYIGDSVMAFWGAPIITDHPAQHAARTALRAIKHMDELNLKWLKEGRSPLYTRIGLNFGEAIVGNLGSDERLNYTAIGDVINTTSRLEHVNKFYGTHIIVSDTFYQMIKNEFVLRFVDTIAVKGREQGSKIYELLAENADELSFNLAEYETIFKFGFSAYQKQQWDIAIDHFKDCLEIYPQDTVAPIFIKRSQEFKLHPPGASWNGLWRMQEK